MSVRDSDMAPCPVCGKPPSVSTSVDPGGAYVKIRCKPLFGHVHLEVERGGAYDAWAYSKAVKAWNILAYRVKEAMNAPVDEVGGNDGRALKLADVARMRELLEYIFCTAQTARSETDSFRLAQELSNIVSTANAAMTYPARMCDKIPNRHKAIYDCRNYLKMHGHKLTSKQDDVMCQTIYWLYDPTSRAEVRYDKEGK